MFDRATETNKNSVTCTIKDTENIQTERRNEVSEIHFTRDYVDSWPSLKKEWV